MSYGAGARPSLEFLDSSVSAAAFNDAFLARIVNAIYRTQWNAETAVDAFFEHDRESSQEVIFHAVNRIDLTWARVIACTASDAGLVDIEVSRLMSHLS
jgi:hypothetical protein